MAGSRRLLKVERGVTVVVGANLRCEPVGGEGAEGDDHVQRSCVCGADGDE